VLRDGGDGIQHSVHVDSGDSLSSGPATFRPACAMGPEGMSRNDAIGFTGPEDPDDWIKGQEPRSAGGHADIRIAGPGTVRTSRRLYDVQPKPGKSCQRAVTVRFLG